MRSHMDRSIERYVAGRMSEAEQREFLRRAAGDANLRRMLRAEQAIVGAVANDRASIAAAASEPAPALLAKLAATRSEGVVALGDGATASAVASGGGLMGILKVLGGLTTTLVVVVGIVMLVRTFRTDDPTGSAPIPAQRTAPAPHPGNSGMQVQQAAPAETAEPAARPAAQKVRSTTQRREAIPGNVSSIAPPSTPTASEGTAAHTATRPRPAEFQEDTLRLRLEVKEKK